MTIPTDQFLPNPDENQIALLTATLNTSGEIWNFHHGDFPGFDYALVQGACCQGEEMGPLFPIRVSATGTCTATLIAGGSSMRSWGMGFRLNLDN